MAEAVPMWSRTAEKTEEEMVACMDRFSSDLHVRSRKLESVVLKRLERVGQATVGKAIGISESSVSLFVSKPEQLKRFCRVLAAAGLKIVPRDAQCFSPRKVQILMELARDHLNQLESVEQIGVDSFDE